MYLEKTLPKKHGTFGENRHRAFLLRDNVPSLNSSTLTTYETVNLVMPIEKARRILGYYAKQLSDDQVRDIIHTLQLLAKEQLSYNGSNKEIHGYGSNTTSKS